MGSFFRSGGKGWLVKQLSVSRTMTVFGSSTSIALLAGVLLLVGARLGAQAHSFNDSAWVDTTVRSAGTTTWLAGGPIGGPAILQELQDLVLLIFTSLSFNWGGAGLRPGQ